MEVSSLNSIKFRKNTPPGALRYNQENSFSSSNYTHRSQFGITHEPDFLRLPILRHNNDGDINKKHNYSVVSALTLKSCVFSTKRWSIRTVCIVLVCLGIITFEVRNGGCTKISSWPRGLFILIRNNIRRKKDRNTLNIVFKEAIDPSKGNIINLPHSTIEKRQWPNYGGIDFSIKEQEQTQIRNHTYESINESSRDFDDSEQNLLNSEEEACRDVEWAGFSFPTCNHIHEFVLERAYNFDVGQDHDVKYLR